MSTFHWEEEKFGKGYDPDLMRRLLHYVKPYKGLFLLAVGLVLFITAIDLSLPFITKTAIDQHIVLPYAAVDAGALDSDQLPDGWQERFGALLQKLHAETGVTILLVSHDLRTVASGASIYSRIACLRRTLHFHDAPAGLTPGVLAEVFEHDLAGVFGDVHVDAHAASECDDPSHVHGGSAG